MEAGTLLLRLDDRVQRANVALAESQVSDTSAVDLAELQVEFEEGELQITRDSARQGGANAQDVREAEFAYNRSVVQLRAAELELEQRRLSMEREAARLAEMMIRAPIGGDVIEVHKKAGETVDELTTVVTLVDTSMLEIDFPVPPSVSAGLSVGDAVSVHWQDIEAPPAEDARIVFIPPTGDATVREVTIRIEIPNPDGLPSGLHGRVRLRSPGGGAG
ncbi:MAG: efflux RND transporter periplasmic adaptor subunit [Planctomycetota bacterium]